MIFFYDLERLLGNQPSKLTALKLLITNTNIQCVFLYRLQDCLYKKRVFFLPKIIFFLNNIITGAEIALGADIGKGLIIRHSNGIVIGHKTKIGSHCTLLHQVTCGEKFGDGKDEKHEYPIIGNNVVVSAGAKIIGGIIIGDNVVIGANAVVTKNIPSDSTAVGIPAYILKTNG